MFLNTGNARCLFVRLGMVKNISLSGKMDKWFVIIQFLNKKKSLKSYDLLETLHQLGQ